MEQYIYNHIFSVFTWCSLETQVMNYKLYVSLWQCWLKRPNCAAGQSFTDRRVTLASFQNTDMNFINDKTRTCQSSYSNKHTSMD